MKAGKHEKERGSGDEFGDQLEEDLEAEAKAFDGDSLVVPVKQALEAGILGQLER